MTEKGRVMGELRSQDVPVQGSDADVTGPDRRSAFLWVNDTATERVAEHGFRYDPSDFKPPRAGVTVSFVAADGRYQRVSFDPLNGDVKVREMPPEAVS